MPDKQTKINEMYLEMLDGPECPAQTFLREYLEKKENRPDFTGIKLINQKKDEVEK
jgi:hypothetical protein